MELSKEELHEIMSDIEPLRYVYHFEDSIDVESVQGLIDILSGYECIDLFFTTPGGEAHAMAVLIHFINNHPDIRIYMTGFIASAGTFLFTDCNKEIILTEDLDWVLFHMGDRVVTNSFRKASVDDRILIEQLREENNNWAAKFAKIGLNKKEVKSYLEGNDVVLYKKDFNRLKINK